jgi:hypothetical protein
VQRILTYYDAASEILKPNEQGRYDVPLPGYEFREDTGEPVPVSGKTALLIEDDSILETLRIPVSEARVIRTQQSFPKGKKYRIEASGTYRWGGCDLVTCPRSEACGLNRYGDAMYLTDDCWGNRFVGWSGVDISLAVNGQNVDWGPYNTKHVYWTTVTGDGGPIKFQLNDCANCHGDNLGSLTVRIHEEKRTR